MEIWEEIARVNELASGDRLSVYVDDTPAILFKLDDTYYCLEDACTHDNEPLTEGELCKGDITGLPAIECPRHGARFDLRTGQALCMPATEGIKVFELRVVGDFIQAKPATGNITPFKHIPSSSIESVEKTIPHDLAASIGDLQIPGALQKHIDALKTVIDPELMINIVDLGLVYGVTQTGGKVDVEMTLTSPACPAGPQIIQQARLSLERLADVDQAEIKLTMTPPWGPERMTDDARDQLGIF